MKKIFFDEDNRKCYGPLTTCGSKIKDIGTSGVGWELYFLFIKHFACTFFILSILASVTVYFNITGGKLHTNKKYADMNILEFIDISMVSNTDFTQYKNR